MLRNQPIKSKSSVANIQTSSADQSFLEQSTLDPQATTLSSQSVQQQQPEASRIEENAACSSDDDKNRESDDDDDDEDDDPATTCYKNLAKPLFSLITSHVMSATSLLVPRDSASLLEFKAFWHTQFLQLLILLDQAEESELFISDPPLKVLEIEILPYRPESEKQCPCCLEYRAADLVVEIREGKGITRGRFVKALAEALYGDGVEVRKLVVRDWDYMMQDKIYFYKGSGYDRMRIWMYCEEVRGERGEGETGEADMGKGEGRSRL